MLDIEGSLDTPLVINTSCRSRPQPHAGAHWYPQQPFREPWIKRTHYATPIGKTQTGNFGVPGAESETLQRRQHARLDGPGLGARQNIGSTSAGSPWRELSRCHSEFSTSLCAVAPL